MCIWRRRRKRVWMHKHRYEGDIPFPLSKKSLSSWSFKLPYYEAEDLGSFLNKHSLSVSSLRAKLEYFIHLSVTIWPNEHIDCLLHIHAVNPVLLSIAGRDFWGSNTLRTGRVQRPPPRHADSRCSCLVEGGRIVQSQCIVDLKPECWRNVVNLDWPKEILCHRMHWYPFCGAGWLNCHSSCIFGGNKTLYGMLNTCACRCGSLQCAIAAAGCVDKGVRSE